MADATDFLEQRILGYWFKNDSFSQTAPSAIYIGLHTADPGETGSVSNELSGNGYTREVANLGSITTDANNNVYLDSNSASQFGPATASWGTVTHISLHDSLSGGNMLFKGELDSSLTVASGDTVSVGSGELRIRVN